MPVIAGTKRNCLTGVEAPGNRSQIPETRALGDRSRDVTQWLQLCTGRLTGDAFTSGTDEKSLPEPMHFLLNGLQNL